MTAPPQAQDEDIALLLRVVVPAGVLGLMVVLILVLILVIIAVVVTYKRSSARKYPIEMNVASSRNGNRDAEVWQSIDTIGTPTQLNAAYSAHRAEVRGDTEHGSSEPYALFYDYIYITVPEVQQNCNSATNVETDPSTSEAYLELCEYVPEEDPESEIAASPSPEGHAGRS